MTRKTRISHHCSSHRQTPAEPPVVLGARFLRLRDALVACTALCAVTMVPARPVMALPQGGKVVEGVAQIIIKSPTEIEIKQSSAKVVIDWHSFNIAANEKVQFVQMDQLAQVLNRVLGPDASKILGQLSANGVVMLSNPNGILIGDGAKVNVGALIATTANIANHDFMAGNLNFDIASGNSTASVVNRGTITAAEAGLVGLVAPGVENSGIIQAKLGKVQLVSGNRFTLDLYGDKLIKVAVTDKVMGQVKSADGQTLAAFVSNKGSIEADGGTILLTANVARDVVGMAVNMDGVARARSVAQANGEIVLDGGGAGLVNVAGTLDAKGVNAGESGGRITIKGETLMQTGTASADGVTKGGNVQIAMSGTVMQAGTVSAEGSAGAGGTIAVTAGGDFMDTQTATHSAKGTTDGGSVTIRAAGQTAGSGKLSARGDAGKGGKVDVFGQNIALAGARIDASGQTQGGSVRIGGDYQGQGTAPRAQTTRVAASTTIDAQARGNGQGGRVITWSEQATKFAGTVKAKGGAGGGFVEVSSKGDLSWAGMVEAAQLLLDPKNLIITTAGGVPYLDLSDPTLTNTKTVGMLDNGNVVISDLMNSVAGTNAGIIKYYNGATGSLISVLTGAAGDKIGGGIVKLTNGNFVVSSGLSFGGRGASTWFNAATGRSGIASAATSMIGHDTTAALGAGTMLALKNGNYTVLTGARHNFLVVNGLTGRTGLVAPTEGLISTTSTFDFSSIGQEHFLTLANGDLLYANGTFLTRIRGDGSSTGIVSTANALLYGGPGQMQHNRLTPLANGKVVLNLPANVNGSSYGVAMLVDPANPVVGTLSSANALLIPGFIYPVITPLTNGNYVVSAPEWNSGAGFAAWASGTSGLTGLASAATGLVGSAAGDYVGSRVAALTGGGYVIGSSSWNGQRGAVTWGQGALTGPLSSANSLIGVGAGDQVGHSVVALRNGHFAFAAPGYDAGGLTDTGAAAWGDGTTGLTGNIDAVGKLVGGAGDMVGAGGVYSLAGGNYAVVSPFWSSSRGAATWMSGNGPASGTVSAANSLIGEAAGSSLGRQLALPNQFVPWVQSVGDGNLLLSSVMGDGRFAFTWFRGAAPTSAVVGADNSILTSSATDGTTSGGAFAVNLWNLANGNYVLTTERGVGGLGTVTWANGNAPSAFTLSADNSLVGASIPVGQSGMGYLDLGGRAFQTIAFAPAGTRKYLRLLPSGDYVVIRSAAGTASLTWGSGTGGVTGQLSAANTIFGLPGQGFADNMTANGAGTVAVPWGSAASSQSGSFVHAGYGGQVYIVLSPRDLSAGMRPGESLSVHPNVLTDTLRGGTNVRMAASNDITINSDIVVSNPNGNGGALTLAAGRSILVNADIVTDNGNLTLIANERAANGTVSAHRDAGDASIIMAAGKTLNAGTGTVRLVLEDGRGNAQRGTGQMTLGTITAATVSRYDWRDVPPPPPPPPASTPASAQRPDQIAKVPQLVNASLPKKTTAAGQPQAASGDKPATPAQAGFTDRPTAMGYITDLFRNTFRVITLPASHPSAPKVNTPVWAQKDAET